MAGRKFVVAGALAALGILMHADAAAQWTTITSGVDYRVFSQSTPQGTTLVYVARMGRADTSVVLDTGLAQGKINGGTETVRNQALRYDDSVSLWGLNSSAWGDWRNDVVVAINGDYQNYSTGTGLPIDPEYSVDAPQSGQVLSGWYAKRFRNYTGGSGLSWQLDRELWIGGCMNHQASKQKVAYPGTGTDQNLNGVNTFRDSNELVLFTPQFDARTGTDSSGVEVLVQMARPTLILPSPSYASGTVTAIHNGAGNTPIPFDSVVLSATGSAATTLLAGVSVGSEVRITQEVTHFASDCSTPAGLDWTKTYAALGGADRLVSGGVVNASLPAAPDRARTAFGYDASFAYLMVMEKSGASAGMDFAEMASFCATTLGCTDAIAQDGGGSSTMWVNGTVVNTPEFTTERAIFNTLFIVKLQAKTQTTTFTVGEPVQASAGAAVRLGPGSNYLPVTTLGSAQAGTIAAHGLNGVRASNTNWWSVSVAGAEGWVSEAQLTSLTGVEAWKMY